MTFLPKEYKVPEPPSGYMKLHKGQNRFRILSSAITGWEYWNQDNKPVRSEAPIKTAPPDIRPDSSVKHFWAFVVWNYEAKAVQILEITQSTIQRGLKIKIDNREGKATDNDFIITREGEGMDTEYDIDVAEASPVPPEATEALRSRPIDLTALYRGQDPFEPSVAPDIAEMAAEMEAEALSEDHSTRPVFGKKPVPQFNTKNNVGH